MYSNSVFQGHQEKSEERQKLSRTVKASPKKIKRGFHARPDTGKSKTQKQSTSTKMTVSTKEPSVFSNSRKKNINSNSNGA